MTTGQILRKLMERMLVDDRPINETELGYITGVQQPTINRLLHDATKDPRKNTIQPLADFFGVSLAQLRGDEPIPGINDDLPAKSAMGEVEKKIERQVSPEALKIIEDTRGLTAYQMREVRRFIAFIKSRNSENGDHFGASC